MKKEQLKPDVSKQVHMKGLYDKSHPVDYEILLKMIIDLKEVFSTFGIRWCAFGGTLIGAYRDKDFAFMIKDGKKVYTDFDIDLFIINTNKEQLLAAFIYLEKIGYMIHSASSNPIVVMKDREWADLCPMSRTSLNYFSSGGFPFHKEFFDWPRKAYIRDEEIFVPNNTEEFLDLYYTPSWRIPKKEHGQFLDNKKLYQRLIERKEKGI